LIKINESDALQRICCTLEKTEARRAIMAEAATKLPVQPETKAIAPAAKATDWQPFESLRNQVDCLFHDFQTGFLKAPSYRSLLGIEPFWRREFGFGITPAIDIIGKDKAYEITAELPGMDEKNIDIQISHGVLTIKGEKQEEKEEKKTDLYVSERRYGSFRRSLRVPDGIDIEKIEASCKSGILTVKLPKSSEAQKNQKTIPISAK
jgi:HSP20 family protein